MAEPVRAKDVQVARIYQARCQIERCRWSGELLGSYQEANEQRLAHLDEHRTLLINNPAMFGGSGG